jgi:hypothetical protein
VKPQGLHSSNRCFFSGLQGLAGTLLPTFKIHRFHVKKKSLGPYDKLKDLVTLGQHARNKLTGIN